LPFGLELTPSGLIRGNPVKSGDYSFVLSVEDTEGNVAGEAFSLEFVDPLAVKTSFIADVTVGVEIDTTLVGGGGNAPYVWQIVDGELPGGISLTTDGQITGNSEQTSIVTFTVRLTDSKERSVDKALTLEIVDPLTFVIPDVPVGLNGKQSLPGGISGSDYEYQMLASGGSQPYEWSITNGSLPPGLEMTETGLIAGVPQVAVVKDVTMRVSDSTGRSSTFPFNFRISVGQEMQTIQARGGTVLVEIGLDSVEYVDITVNTGFEGFVIATGPKKVQVHFIGNVSQIPSWVLCESEANPRCSFD